MADRTALLERYRALPLPDTSMEAWRFTDLVGFDPDAFTVPNGHPLSQRHPQYRLRTQACWKSTQLPWPWSARAGSS